MVVKPLVQLQFWLDEANKPQVMFYFPEIKTNRENIVHLGVCECQDFYYSPEGGLQFR